MKIRPVIYLFFALFMSAGFSGCNKGMDESRIRKVNHHSLEVTRKYLLEQHKVYDFLLKRKIKKVDKSIQNLRNSVSESGMEADKDLNRSLAALENEKELLELQRSNLQEKTAATLKLVENQWKQYNLQLDTTLYSMQLFLNNMKELRTADLR